MPFRLPPALALQRALQQQQPRLEQLERQRAEAAAEAERLREELRGWEGERRAVAAVREQLRELQVVNEPQQVLTSPDGAARAVESHGAWRSVAWFWFWFSHVEAWSGFVHVLASWRVGVGTWLRCKSTAWGSEGKQWERGRKKGRWWFHNVPTSRTQVHMDIHISGMDMFPPHEGATYP